MLKSISLDIEKLKAALHGKIYVGSSAGANYLAKNYLSHDGQAVGTGILPLNVVVHYDSDDPNEARSVADAKKLAQDFPDHPTLLLREGEFAIIEGASV